MYDSVFETARAQILSAPNGTYPVSGSGRTYYVSPNGNDANDGLSAAAAWKTISKVNSASIASGSVVLFERGGVWNREGTLSLKNGVTYAAYGTGDKPMISNFVEANQTSDWTNVGGNVWVYSGSYSSPVLSDQPNDPSLAGSYLTSAQSNGTTAEDVGNIVFLKSDGTQGFGVKVMKYNEANTSVNIGTVNNGFTNVTRGATSFAGYADLASDYEFYHDRATDRLYLRYSGGNPASAFASIRIVLGGYLVGGECRNVTLENLSVSYTGCHGISIGNATNFTVRNCAFEWIGGSIQKYDFGGKAYPTRFGNAFQNWAACNGILIEDCLFNQIYDASVTSQTTTDGSKTECAMDSITIRNNLFENHVYGIEMWSRGTEAQIASENFRIRDMVVTGNLFRRNGYGIGMTRDDKNVSSAFWCSMGYPNVRIENCKIFNNVIWDYSEQAIGGLTFNMNNGYQFYNNALVVKNGAAFVYFPKDFKNIATWDAKKYTFSVSTVDWLISIGILGENQYFYE